MRRGPLVWIALVALPAGCSHEVPSLELGTGRGEFEPLAPRQDVPIVAGTQGGHHVFVSVRARGIAPDGVALHVSAAPVESGAPRQRSTRAMDLVAEDGFYRAVGVPVVLSTPECFQDRVTRIEVAIEDADGVLVEDVREVVPRWPEPLGTCAP